VGKYVVDIWWYYLSTEMDKYVVQAKTPTNWIAVAPKHSDCTITPLLNRVLNSEVLLILISDMVVNLNS
jgi:hypothetical protein